MVDWVRHKCYLAYFARSLKNNLTIANILLYMKSFDDPPKPDFKSCSSCFIYCTRKTLGASNKALLDKRYDSLIFHFERRRIVLERMQHVMKGAVRSLEY